MASEWQYIVYALTVNMEIGNALAGAMGVAPGDNLTFTKGTKLRPIGSDDTDPSAWLAAVPLKQSGHDIVAEFAAGGYPALFTGAGFTHAQIDLARASITLEYGPRSEVEGHGLAFIAAQGYEIIPDA